MVKTQLQRAWVRSLVGELRSHMLCGMAKKKQRQKKNALKMANRVMGENVRGDLSRGDQGQDLTAEGTFRDQAAAGMQLPPPEAGGTGVAKALGLD